jgi:DNA polymerase-1
MGGHPTQPTRPIPAPAGGNGTTAPLLLVDGHNLLWAATFGFPAPIHSRDKTRLLTGLFAFFALLRAAASPAGAAGA